MKLLSHRVPWIRRNKRGAWKYVITSDSIYDLGFDAGQGEMRSDKGKLLMTWKANILIIYAGYAWDGMTMFPDSDRNKAFSLVHDACYQGSNCDGFPFTREEVDGWAWDLLGPIERRIVLPGVRMFGGLFWQHGITDCYITIFRTRP